MPDAWALLVGRVWVGAEGLLQPPDACDDAWTLGARIDLEGSGLTHGERCESSQASSGSSSWEASPGAISAGQRPRSVALLTELNCKYYSNVPPNTQLYFSGEPSEHTIKAYKSHKD